MSQCDPQIFPNFNDTCVQALLTRVQGEGVDTAAKPGANTSGTANRAGFEIAWSYDAPTQTLTVQCTSSPFYVPCNLIQAQIRTWIEACYPSDPS